MATVPPELLLRVGTKARVLLLPDGVRTTNFLLRPDLLHEGERVVVHGPVDAGAVEQVPGAVVVDEDGRSLPTGEFELATVLQ